MIFMLLMSDITKSLENHLLVKGISSQQTLRKMELMDKPFDITNQTMLSNKSRLWASIELGEKYRNVGGTFLSRRRSVNKV